MEGILTRIDPTPRYGAWRPVVLDEFHEHGAQR